MEHVFSVPGYEGRLRKLAILVINLRYWAVARFFGYLAEKLEKDAVADSKRKRNKLVYRLRKTAKYLCLAQKQMEEAWRISKPFMRKGRVTSGNNRGGGQSWKKPIKRY